MSKKTNTLVPLRELFLRDPGDISLPNNGVSKVEELSRKQQKGIDVLRFEMETFVCEGAYERGLTQVMGGFLGALGQPEQKAAWISGFFGSGKSHLVKMLRYLWDDYRFPDGATARSVVKLPGSVRDLFVELTTRAKPYGGVQAVSGTLGSGSDLNIRTAFLQILFRGMGLPEKYPAARFLLDMRERGHEKELLATLAKKVTDPTAEINNRLYMSVPLSEAILKIEPKYKDEKHVQEMLKSQYPAQIYPTIDDVIKTTRDVFQKDGQLPLVLIVADEIQQFVGQNLQKISDIQEIAENICTRLDSRVLLVGTGQEALTTTQNLGRLQARFAIRVGLSNADVECVLRKTVLAKKPNQEKTIENVLDQHAGEIGRHLQSTRLSMQEQDREVLVSDYPILPTRRKFWEKVLRTVDTTQASSQLRTQLRIAYEALKENASQNLGYVIPGDFIYDKIQTDLRNQGRLRQEFYEIIEKQLKKGADGKLRRRIASLIFLIGELPREKGADDGVRATPDNLADLLVEDLEKDPAVLRERIPGLLDAMHKEGDLMLVGNEYLLQTQEGASWNTFFDKKLIELKSKAQDLAAIREETLANALLEEMENLSVTQGASKTSRQIAIVTGDQAPQENTDQIPLWVRNGWNAQEKDVVSSAQAAGITSPTVFVYLPTDQRKTDSLHEAIATRKAAQATLENRGHVTTSEAISAKRSIESRSIQAEEEIKKNIRVILENAKVLNGGGQEANGVTLLDRVKEAAETGAARLYQRFHDADHTGWPMARTRAIGGDVGALQAVGHRGDVKTHTVCSEIRSFVQAGKKGKDVREKFTKTPYGWPRDTIDGALIVLMLAGELRATLNHKPVTVRELPQNQIGQANFYVDHPPLDMGQRMELKVLFNILNVNCPVGKEDEAAGIFLDAALATSEKAGGEAPLPEKPAVQYIRELQALSGNQQLSQILLKKDDLKKDLEEWKRRSEAIQKKLPAWRELNALLDLSAGLSDLFQRREQVESILDERRLLADPDVIPELSSNLVDALRKALQRTRTSLESAHATEKADLEKNSAWQKTPEEQKKILQQKYGLSLDPAPALGSSEDVQHALKTRTLDARDLEVSALPEKFRASAAEAAQLLEPKIRRIKLPSGSFKSEADIEKWISDVEVLLKQEVKKGPIML